MRFIITAMHSEQTEAGQVITMTDNIDRQYELGSEFPLEIGRVVTGQSSHI